MKTKLKFLLVLLPIIAISFIGFTTMGLWNWIMPALFGLGTITFFKALGLLILSRILLGGIFKSVRNKAYHNRMQYAYVKSNRCGIKMKNESAE